MKAAPLKTRQPSDTARLDAKMLAFFILLFSVSLSGVSAIPFSLEPTPSLAKRATCTPASAQSSSTDDVPAIQSAFATCGNGGVIVIAANTTYAIRSTLSFAGCKGCEFRVEGTMKVSSDTDYWDGVRAVILLDGISGATIHSTTSLGLIDGNGQRYHSRKLRFKNAPNVFHSVVGGSTNILYSGLTLTAAKADDDGADPKNTDGFDVGKSTYVEITNTTITNQDDCVAFKPGANYVTVTDITCKGSHGLSVGSLAGGAGSTDTVTNVYVNHATMIDSTKAVGIKLYQGGSSHGTATVKNVTYNDITVDGCDYAAQIQSCYGSDTTAECTAAPSTATLTDVYFTNFKGTTSDKACFSLSRVPASESDNVSVV
ncbi:related to polygalacturonase 1 precursor [Armillaria ostoyae]|uniref:Related to polygalacturonase 1 n=1 Tax=Armillaria ostoyae TaxID=47428 RepID=A0A284QL59_ARMOS|nr:related to polygalacturonase 1 precursor [Armillaria ostoyae]